MSSRSLIRLTLLGCFAASIIHAARFQPNLHATASAKSVGFDPAFLYKASHAADNVELLIVGSMHIAPFGGLTWRRQLMQNIQALEPSLCLVENPNFEWTLNAFTRLTKLSEQAAAVMGNPSDESKKAWIEQYKVHERESGFEVTETFTREDFERLSDQVDQDIGRLSPEASGVDVNLFNIFTHLSRASGGQLAVDVIEAVEDADRYIAEMNEVVLTGAVVEKAKGVKSAYLRGDAGEVFEFLDAYLLALNEKGNIPQRNTKWADTVQAKVKSLSTAHRAVVVVGTSHLAGPRSILDAFKSMGYSITAVDI